MFGCRKTADTIPWNPRMHRKQKLDMAALWRLRNRIWRVFDLATPERDKRRWQWVVLRAWETQPLGSPREIRCWVEVYEIQPCRWSHLGIVSPACVFETAIEEKIRWNWWRGARNSPKLLPAVVNPIAVAIFVLKYWARIAVLGTQSRPHPMPLQNPCANKTCQYSLQKLNIIWPSIRKNEPVIVRCRAYPAS